MRLQGTFCSKDALWLPLTYWAYTRIRCQMSLGLNLDFVLQLWQQTTMAISSTNWCTAYLCFVILACKRQGSSSVGILENGVFYFQIK